MSYNITERSTAKIIYTVTTKLHKGDVGITLLIDITNEERKSYPDLEHNIIIKLTVVSPYQGINTSSDWEFTVVEDDEDAWWVETNNLMYTLKAISTPNVKLKIDY